MSDEVSQFLEQVERLRGQQVEDDEVRAREREEFLAGKRERQARREERARSISPQKSSPANTPSPRANRRTLQLSESLKLDSPSNEILDKLREPSAEPDKAADDDTPSDPMTSSASSTKESEAQMDSESSTVPSRASLSWQKRPNSRPNSRPLSVVATQNAIQKSLADSQEPPSPSEPLSKEQIAQSLGSKDPSWFRQTADRGQSSAAYRRNQVEDEDRLDMSSVSAQLPGMMAETPKERPVSQSSASIPGQGKLTSPLPLNPPRFESHAGEQPQADQSIAAAAGRTSPIRSGSPTKGMGGFVQSAMMKRNDSVKRWSVASSPGLTRADSIAANRSTFDRSLPPTTASRPQSMIRDKTTTPGTSRPTSRHGEKEAVSSAATSKDDAPKTPPAKSSPTQEVPKQAGDDGSLPVSPSKTMEPRRWSPTKSSWLESALNKPETPPKPQQKPPPPQPAWMAEINKNKAERSNSITAAAAASHKHQVSIGGLMRSSPMGSVLSLNTTGLGGIYSPPTTGSQSASAHISSQSLAGAATSLAPSLEPSKMKPQDHRDLKEKKSEYRGSVPVLPVTRAKPEAPPKKDFRANLKPRVTEAATTKSEEPEFKSVFGTLRRAKTQNFRPQDELKDNILRGKAALNPTDGPQKSASKDEFKDAILKKRDDFKKAQVEGKGVTTNATARTEKLVPEGLVKRAELGKSAGARRDSVPEKRSPSGQGKKTVSPKPTPPKRKSSQVNLLARQSSPALTPMKSPSTERSSRRESAQPGTPTQSETSPHDLHSLLKKKSAPSRLGGGKLAERFNPALAGMLARGPPPMTANGGQRTEESGQGQKSSGGATETSQPGPQLTHMTKNRARGPKRKAPTASPFSSTETLGEKLPVGRQSAGVLTPVEENKPAPLSIQQQVAAKAGAVQSMPEPIKTKDTPMGFARSAERVAPLNLRKQPAAPARPSADLSSPPKSPQKSPSDEPQPDSPRKLDVKRMSKFLDQTDDAKPEPAKEAGRLTHQKTGSWSPVKNDARPLAEPAKEPGKLTHQRTGSWSPVKRSERTLPDPTPSSPTKPKRDSIPSVNNVPSVNNAAAMFGGLAAKAPPPGPKPSCNASSREVAEAPQTPRGSSRPLPKTPPNKAKTPSPVISPAKQGGDVSSLLNDFFGSPRQRKECKVDPVEILMNHPKAGAKIKTLSFHMFQISGDGKQAPVAAHHERVLFEQEMYIAAHNFTNEAGWKVREVYFWIGDEVSGAAIEEAQVVAQKEAKSLGGKLIKMRQGKESSEFLQALGGVVIVRRGSSKRYDSLAPVMLCGRRHLGQVAFDEVAFTTASLCAGFAYLITHSGKCFLWKGKGSDVDELSCARLIGMDLTLTGELIEYDEGSEPASFWQMLDGGARPHSADHWRLKPGYGKYCSRLFCSDADSRQQIFEISPFSQADMSPSGIYVIDAFFEMYIIVGSQAQAQYASFRNALDFAQEYSILAASMEDRPFVPVSTVVLEGAPRDLKRVFRKWTDDRCPTTLNAAAAGRAVAEPGLKRGRSLKVVPLTQALLALKE